MSTGRTVTLDCTPLAARTVEALREDGLRYLVHEGGTRSSKTQSIAQALLVEALCRPVEIDVCRESMPVLRRSAMGDFISWAKEASVYSEEAHHKTHDTLKIPCPGGESTIRFYGADADDKLKGPERDIQWINEANEIGVSAFREIRRRTRETIVIDYNPSHGRSHWIDELVMGSGREKVIRSTYRDNPFLPEEQVKDIEADVPVYREEDGTEIVDWTLDYDGDGVLISGDPAEWAVYGLGKRAASDRIIFPHWMLIDRLPEEYDDRAYGLDFGWNNPCVLVECRWKDVKGEDENLYWHEHFRGAELKNADLKTEFEEAGVPPDVPVFCDHDPDRIDYLQRQGYKARPADKSDYETSVRTVKDFRLIVTRASGALRKELEGLKWKTDADGEILDEPVKKADHGPDAGRYGTHSHRGGRPSVGGAFDSMRDSKDEATVSNNPLISMR